MIRFTLRCDNEHEFESWFKSGAAFDSLQSAGHVSCAVCGSDKVSKAVMAPRVRPARNAATPEETPGDDRPLSGPKSAAEQALAHLRRRIEEQSDDVGREFASEARRIHAGEAPKRDIIGEARPDEARRLLEDGIPVAPLPWGPARKTN